jgi:hypothetical protein
VRCEELSVLPSDRLVSPSAERNKAPISAVLSQVLPKCGVVLEVGSGTGQHVVEFALAMPNLIWQPSERDADCLRSIRAWLAAEKLSNVRPPLELDVNVLPWPIDSAGNVRAIASAPRLSPAPRMSAWMCSHRSWWPKAASGSGRSPILRASKSTTRDFSRKTKITGD